MLIFISLSNPKPLTPHPTPYIPRKTTQNFGDSQKYATYGG